MAVPLGFFIFSCYCFLLAASLVGLAKPEAGLTIAVIQLASGPSYLIASLISLKDNDSVGGNLFFIFSTLFGFVSGAVNLVSYFATMHHWPMDTSICGLIWLLLALFLVFTLPIFIYAPMTDLILIVFSIVSLALLGLLNFGLIPPTITVVIGWLMAAIGLIAFYSCAAAYLQPAGIKLPVPKSLFEKKDTSVHA